MSRPGWDGRLLRLLAKEWCWSPAVRWYKGTTPNAHCPRCEAPPGRGEVALHTYSTTLVNYDSQSHPLNSSQMPSTVERERIHYRIAVIYFARQVRISQSLWLRPSPTPTHPPTHTLARH